MTNAPKEDKQRWFTDPVENEVYLRSLKEIFPEYTDKTDKELMAILDQNTQRERLHLNTDDDYKEWYGHRLDQKAMTDAFLTKKDLLSVEWNVELSNGYQYWTGKLSWYIHYTNVTHDDFILGKSIIWYKETFQLDDTFDGLEICNTTFNGKWIPDKTYGIWIEKSKYRKFLDNKGVPQDSINDIIEKKTNPKLSAKRRQDEILLAWNRTTIK